MKTYLLLEMETNVEPTSAARAFSEAPRVVNVLSIVDEMPFEIWRDGEHIASETSHPIVERAKRAAEEIHKAQEEANG